MNEKNKMHATSKQDNTNHLSIQVLLIQFIIIIVIILISDMRFHLQNM